MKKLITNYVFNPGAGNVTFLETETITLEQVLLITNVTTNQIVYNFADPLKGGSIVNNVLTFDFDVSAMNVNDKLQIFAEVENPDMQDELFFLRRILKVLESNGTVDVANRQRVAVETCVLSPGSSAIGVTGTPIATASNHGNTPFSINPYSSAGALTANVISEWPVDQRWRILHEARTAYATGIRNNLIS